MAKVGLKDTLSLLAKGYSKKEIDALAAIDEEQEALATDEAQSEAPAPVEDKKAPVEDNQAPEDAAAKESIQEPDYKKMYEDLLKKNEQTEAKVTKLQQANVNKDSAPASEEAQKKQEEDLQNLFRSFM